MTITTDIDIHWTSKGCLFKNRKHADSFCRANCILQNTAVKIIVINGIGETLGPQLMAEIGDVRRFSKRSNITAFAGVDAPPFQSGKIDSKSRRISKRGSCELRKQLFQVVRIIVQLNLYDDPVYQFVMRKKAEGKPYYVYMVAGCNKLLRIYYARVKEYLAAVNAI